MSTNQYYCVNLVHFVCRDIHTNKIVKYTNGWLFGEIRHLKFNASYIGMYDISYKKLYALNRLKKYFEALLIKPKNLILKRFDSIVAGRTIQVIELRPCRCKCCNGWLTLWYDVTTYYSRELASILWCYSIDNGNLEGMQQHHHTKHIYSIDITHIIVLF